MARQAIPYGRQHITEADVAAVTEALHADYLTTGPTVTQFEQAFAAYVEADYAVAVANGTAALHLCALALNVQSGDRVITTPITFAASANCVRYCGGEVWFSDIDPDSLTLDVNEVRKLVESKPKGFFKGIIPVDFAGNPCNLEAFRVLADEHDLWIIEDACHAPGGAFKDSKGTMQRCGNGRFAELAIFSFHPVKHIACGEGGMITTNDKTLYESLLQLRTHGITRQAELLKNEPHGGWYMEMQQLGYNYRIPDILCALGISQLKRADEGMMRRHEIAKRYDRVFADFKVAKPEIKLELHPAREGDFHAYHLYIIEVEDRKGLYDFLRTKNIFAQVHYIPVHSMPYYAETGHYYNVDLGKSEAYYAGGLSLPMYPSLTDEEQAYVIDCVKSFLDE